MDDTFEAPTSSIQSKDNTELGYDSQNSDDEDGGGADDLEKQIAKEVASMKRPRRETRFGMATCMECYHDANSFCS